MILVIDDEQECRTAVTGILTSEGFGVQAAADGPVALAAIEDSHPELILLDTRMPGIDGFEVWRRLRENEKTREIPVVFLSTAGEVDEREAALRSGAADFISKPLRREELLSRVRTQLELLHLRRDLEKCVEERTAELCASKVRLELELDQRERDEAILREKEEGFRQLADFAPVGVWVMASDQRLLFHNKRGLRLGAKTKHQLSGDEWMQIVHPDDLAMVRQEYAMAVKERRGFRIEYRVRSHNGSIRWVLNTGIPRFVGRNFAGHIGATIDITSLKRSQERLILEYKLESLECLAAGIAHDFNNLVGSIYAASELALADLPQDSPARTNIERINTVAGRASEIVSMLMAYAGEYGVRTERLNLSLVVAEIVEILRGTVAPKMVMTTKLTPDLPEVHANVTQVRQVILNLIVNALEAVQSTDGIVYVSTDRLSIDRNSPERGVEAGDYCRLTVADNGCGMPPAVCSKIFDPFYSTKFIGRGLGLAVVQGIVRSLGGSIHLRTAPGEGSVFEVLLPCASHKSKANGTLQSATAGAE